MDQSETTPANDSSNASNNQASVDPPSRPSLLGYFYGRITREEAELILKERGGEEGLFLLRDNVSSIGNYVISTCHGTRVFHYSVEKQVDGKYTVPEGEPFLDPAELVEYYRTSKDDLIPQLLYPCERLTGQIPVAFRGVAYHQLEKAMLIEAKKMKADVARALGPMRDEILRRVAATLHADMPWFHGKLTHQEAEDRLAKDKHVDGKFLVRQRETNAFALTLSNKGQPEQYFVTQRYDKRFAIEDGAHFDSLMMLVDHYHDKADGLACKLRTPCCRPNYTNTDIDQYMVNNSARWDSFSGNDYSRAKAPSQHAPPNPARQDRPSPAKAVGEHAKAPSQHAPPNPALQDRPSPAKAVGEQAKAPSQHAPPNPALQDRPSPAKAVGEQAKAPSQHAPPNPALQDRPSPAKAVGEQAKAPSQHAPPNPALQDRPSPAKAVGEQAKAPSQHAPPNPARQDRPSPAKAVDEAPYLDLKADIHAGAPYMDVNSNTSRPTIDVAMASTGEELKRDHGGGSVRKEVTIKKLMPSQIVLGNLKLGEGNFGSVMKGEIPVAVKTLKKTELDPGVQCELTKEAEVMKTMDHKHIVRMIGLCEGETMMLVLELAKLGPLDTFLSKNKQVPLWNILELMWQVAQGMAYLEAQGFVHRDLAARNILLCDQHFAKVSGFGMTEALSGENNEYVAQGAEKWPIEWYPLECINSRRFDSKSDVWSFGVALWEAASYGAKPYNKMKALDIFELLRNGGRLARPTNCSHTVYVVILQCWKEAEDRPTFVQLVHRMEELYLSHKTVGINSPSAKGAPRADVAMASTGEHGRGSARKDVTIKKLMPSQIVLENFKLGEGNFGPVIKGVFRMDGRELPVAVKTLKKKLDPGAQCELTKQAEVMKTMDHKHIVRMIGLCEGETMMLVLELAKLGPLDTFLSKNKQVPLWNILELMWQVAQGMAYLEAQGFVHRDLAARNILLCDQHFAKVSGFGMTEALSGENNEYVPQEERLWQIKWYAPECTDSLKFDSKSDVWSFGVALWEAASYGAKPYNEMKTGSISSFVKRGGRLTKPMNCAEEVYEVMMECWTIAGKDRPSFAQLVPQMEDLYLSYQVHNV